MRIEVSLDVSIWELNPHLELISEFKAFKKKEGDEQSSKILTAISYIYDAKSPMRDGMYTEEEVIEQLTETLFDGEVIDWDDYSYVVDLYNEHIQSFERVRLNSWKNELEGLEDLLKTWGWDQNTAKEKITLLASLPKLWAEYSKIKAIVDNEDDEFTSRGNYVKSLVEEFGE